MNFTLKRRTNPLLLQAIPIEKISIYSPTHRKSFDNYEISQLAESIRINGILEPLDVIREEEKYKIISGNRRYRAAKLIGLTTLPCRIITEEGSKLLMSVINSRYNRPLNVFEEAEYLNDILDSQLLTPGDMAEKLNLTQKGLSNILKVLRFNADERKLILKENLNLRQMTALLRLHDETLREKILEEIVELRLSPIETERYVDKIINPSTEEKVEIKQNTAVFLDKRVLDNTFSRLLTTAAKSGINITLSEAESDTDYQYIFRVPKQTGTAKTQ